MSATVARTAIEEAGLTHVSPSSLNRFIRCPESYRQRYIVGKKDPAGGKALVGSAVDKAVGDYYTARIGGGPGLELEAMQDSFRDHLLNESESESYVLDNETPGEMIDKALPLVAAYYPVAKAKPDPVAVQKRIEITRPSLPVPIIGFVDVRFDAHLIDLKVAANRSVHPDWRIANRIYSAAEGVPAAWDVVTKTKVPVVYTASDGDEYQESWSAAKADRTVRMVGQIMGSINSMLMMFGTDDPWPTLGISHPWSCLVCAYRKDCSAWT